MKGSKLAFFDRHFWWIALIAIAIFLSTYALL